MSARTSKNQKQPESVSRAWYSAAWKMTRPLRIAIWRGGDEYGRRTVVLQGGLLGTLVIADPRNTRYRSWPTYAQAAAILRVDLEHLLGEGPGDGREPWDPAEVVDEARSLKLDLRPVEAQLLTIAEANPAAHSRDRAAARRRITLAVSG